MIKNLPQQRLQQIVDFVIDNYDSAPESFFPQNVRELLDKNGNDEIFISEDEHGIDAICLATVKYETIVELHRGVVRLDVREMGVFKNLCSIMENTLLNNGIKKIQSFVLVNNTPSVILGIKMGMKIEGLLRNQDGRGMEVYVMGKELNNA